MKRECEQNETKWIAVNEFTIEIFYQ